MCYGKDATDEEIEAAVAAANAKDFIAASPEGIYTMVIPLSVDYVAQVRLPYVCCVSFQEPCDSTHVGLSALLHFTARVCVCC